MHLQNGEDKDRRKRGFGNDGSRKGRGDGKRDDLYATWRRKTKAGHPDARRARDDGGQSKTSLSNRRDHRKLRHAPATPNAHARALSSLISQVALIRNNVAAQKLLLVKKDGQSFSPTLPSTHYIFISSDIHFYMVYRMETCSNIY